MHGQCTVASHDQVVRGGAFFAHGGELIPDVLAGLWVLGAVACSGVVFEFALDPIPDCVVSFLGRVVKFVVTAFVPCVLPVE